LRLDGCECGHAFSSMVRMGWGRKDLEGFACEAIDTKGKEARNRLVTA
jgi:hypothetical protein